MRIANQHNNAPALTQVKVSVPSGIASSFKSACKASNVSMAAEISQFMSGYSDGSVKRKAAPNYSTRRNRRTVIRNIISELTNIKACEERVRDNTPVNLQGSDPYQTTEEAISLIEEAIELLSDF